MPVRLPETREGRIGCLLAFGVIASPFLALLYSATAALGVLALATGVTAWIAFDASKRADDQRRASLLMATILNAAFALISALMLVNRLR